jgi:hypothetical protein
VARTTFVFHHDLPVVEVQLVGPGAPGTVVSAPLRLLVDSGFTGRSHLILSYADGRRFGRSQLPASRARGALSGVQIRVEVSCAGPSIGTRLTLTAICADLQPLALPDGIVGLAGLNFLTCFAGWGARQGSDRTWSFSLETGEDG